jgi:predicted enzyme related to lactoylglutathione lyase
MPRVVHFEIHAAEPDRAVRFYRELLGWEITRWEGPMEYWIVRTGEGPGIDGGLLRRQGGGPAPGQPVNAYVCTVDVPDLDDAIARGTSLGAAVAVPRMAVPGLGWLAYITDPEGNILGMMQMDPSAQ